MQETFKRECSVHMHPLRVVYYYYFFASVFGFVLFLFFASEKRLVKINDGIKEGNCKLSNIARKVAQAFSFN